jgi:hypothetical protein
MAFHSSKDFAALCGLKTKDLSNYVKRGKVVRQNDLIDDKDQINQAFMKKREVKLVEKGIVDKPETSGNPGKPAKPKKEGKREKTEAEVLFKLKSDLELEKRQNEIDLQKLAIAKIRGDVVPVPAVRELIRTYSESSRHAYTEASDNLLMIMTQKFNLTATDLSDVRKEFLKLVNKAIDNAVDNTKTVLLGLVRDYSKKRGVGQHD